MTVDTFKEEIEQAIQAYDKFIVCLGYSTEEFKQGVRRLVAQAIKVYENRGEGYRHGFALNEFITVILSQTEGDRPYCGIYFNLFSPYISKLKTQEEQNAAT